jgi:type IV secretion system protein VirD4
MRRSDTVQRSLMLLGVPIAGALVSSAVAWKFDYQSALGEPLLGVFYNPLAAIRWWNAWGWEPAYRSDFLAAVMLAVFVGVILMPVGSVFLLRRFGSLWLEDRDPDQGLGQPADLLKTGEVKADGDRGSVLGYGDRGSWRRWWKRDILRDVGDGHAILAGRPRGGKGANGVVPTIVTHRGPKFIFDPKAELAAITRRECAKHGAVYELDPTNRATACINPLLTIPRGDGLITGCAQYARILAFSGEENDKERTWSEATAEMFTALLAHLRCGPDRMCTVGELWALVTKIKAGIYPKPNHPLAKSWMDGHRTTFKEVRDSVNFTASTRLAFLADPLVRHALSRNDFKMSDLAAEERPVTVFVTIPDALSEQFRPFARLLVQAFWASMTTSLHATDDGRRKRHTVLAILDEFPRLGRLSVIESGIATCAGYGLRLMLVCQDFEQLKKTYGQYQPIVSMCTTISVIPGFSGSSLATMKEWAGEHAVSHASRNRHRLSESENRQSILNARDLLRRSDKEVIVFRPGVPPTWLKKIRYWKDARLKALCDDPARVNRTPGPAQEEDLPWLAAA